MTEPLEISGKGASPYRPSGAGENVRDAVLIFNNDGTVEEFVGVPPSAPVISGDQVTFEVSGIEGNLPASGGAVSLFIDPIGLPLSPNSVAGVHRRHRRRAIRRHN